MIMVRKWILNALYAVIFEHAYSNLYLKQNLHQVKEKDRKLATQIFYGTLQNYRYCEAIWKQHANTKQKVPLKIKILLTMSVYQMLFLKKVPSYAIIDEAVEIAKQTKVHTAGFVNAILRKVEKDPSLPEQDPQHSLALRYSLPDWLIKMWIHQYGEQKTEEIAKASNASLPLSIRRNLIDTSEDEIRSLSVMELLQDPIYLYSGGAIYENPYYSQGKISIQDAGAYEIVRFLNPQKEEWILDTCAAPGTKTMAIAERIEGTGEITALDLHAHRVQLIENDIERLHLHNVIAQQQDASDLEGFGLYDRVLCDVPCSGYGTLSRKPDIKLEMKPEDMDSLIPLQYKILEEGAKHVKYDGILVYSTCTLNKKENEKQIERFLKAHNDFEKVDEKTLFPTSIHNGFYMAKLKRKEDVHEKHL